MGKISNTVAGLSESEREGLGLMEMKKMRIGIRPRWALGFNAISGSGLERERVSLTFERKKLGALDLVYLCRLDFLGRFWVYIYRT